MLLLHCVKQQDNGFNSLLYQGAKLLNPLGKVVALCSSTSNYERKQANFTNADQKQHTIYRKHSPHYSVLRCRWQTRFLAKTFFATASRRQIYYKVQLTTSIHLLFKRHFPANIYSMVQFGMIGQCSHGSRINSVISPVFMKHYSHRHYDIFARTKHFKKCETKLHLKLQKKKKINKKYRWDSGKPRRQQILFCDIQIKVVIRHRQIYVYHTDLLPLKI